MMIAIMGLEKMPRIKTPAMSRTDAAVKAGSVLWARECFSAPLGIHRAMGAGG